MRTLPRQLALAASERKRSDSALVSLAGVQARIAMAASSFINSRSLDEDPAFHVFISSLMQRKVNSSITSAIQ